MDGQVSVYGYPQTITASNNMCSTFVTCTDGGGITHPSINSYYTTPSGQRPTVAIGSGGPELVGPLADYAAWDGNMYFGRYNMTYRWYYLGPWHFMSGLYYRFLATVSCESGTIDFSIQKFTDVPTFGTYTHAMTIAKAVIGTNATHPKNDTIFATPWNQDDGAGVFAYSGATTGKNTLKY